jgi:hypothetical protein
MQKTKTSIKNKKFEIKKAKRLKARNKFLKKKPNCKVKVAFVSATSLFNSNQLMLNKNQLKSQIASCYTMLFNDFNIIGSPLYVSNEPIMLCKHQLTKSQLSSLQYQISQKFPNVHLLGAFVYIKNNVFFVSESELNQSATGSNLTLCNSLNKCSHTLQLNVKTVLKKAALQLRKGK